MCFSDVIRVLYCLPQFRFAIIWIANQWLWLDRSWYQNANKYTRFMQLIRIIIQLAKIWGGGHFYFGPQLLFAAGVFPMRRIFPSEWTMPCFHCDFQVKSIILRISRQFRKRIHILLLWKTGDFTFATIFFFF